MCDDQVWEHPSLFEDRSWRSNGSLSFILSKVVMMVYILGLSREKVIHVFSLSKSSIRPMRMAYRNHLLSFQDDHLQPESYSKPAPGIEMPHFCRIDVQICTELEACNAYSYQRLRNRIQDRSTIVAYWTEHTFLLVLVTIFTFRELNRHPWP